MTGKEWIQRGISWTQIETNDLLDLGDTFGLKPGATKSNEIEDRISLLQVRSGDGFAIKFDPFNDELLDIRGTLIEIGFDACDNALWVGAGACSASFYTKERNSAIGVFVSAGFSIFTTTDAEEWNIGDYIEINTSGGTIETMRIIGKTTDLIGTIAGTWRFTVGSSSQPYFIH